MEDSFSTEYAEDMVWLGEAEFTLQELPSLDVAEIEEDEYISALKKHIEDVLRQNGRYGKERESDYLRDCGSDSRWRRCNGGNSRYTWADD